MNRTGSLHTCKHARHAPHNQRCVPGRMRGFTLVELMITLFVAAILVTIAVPSFQHIIATSKLTTTANTMVGALHVARMQAIKRNADTQFCSNDSNSNGSGKLGTACATHSGAVYVLTGTAAAASAVKVRAATLVDQGRLHLDGNIVPLRFDAQGLAHALNDTAPYTGEVADICTTAIHSGNHRIIHMTTGSIIQVTTSDGTCQ